MAQWAAPEREWMMQTDEEVEFWTSDRQNALRARIAMAGEQELRLQAMGGDLSTVAELEWSQDQIRWASDLYFGVGRKMVGPHDCAWCAVEVAGTMHLRAPMLCRGKVRSHDKRQEA
jgi:hypothetical protein